MDACVTKAPKKLSVSEKIDRVVTNRVLGIPIFIVVMVFVYWLAISTVGTGGTDWVNDNLFGDGFFINSASEEAYTAEQEVYDAHYYGDQIEGYLAAAEADGIATEGVADAVSTLSADPEDAEAQATLMHLLLMQLRPVLLPGMFLFMMEMATSLIPTMRLLPRLMLKAILFLLMVRSCRFLIL